MTSAATRLFGVLGWPVAHSRSPAIHTAALAARGIDAVYLAFAVPPDALGRAIEGLYALGATGVNLTLPHKERVMSLLDTVEAPAKAIGAVNTIVREGDRLVGTNTDGAGLARSLVEAGADVRGRRVLVIGGGGAARASVVGLREAGAAHIDVAARRESQAIEVAALAGGGACDLRDARALARMAEEADVLVQATSATLAGAPDPEGFAASVPIASLPPEAVVVDLVYAPLETAVLRAAKARGLQTVDGLGMLVWQAAIAFERWHGVEAPIAAMRAAARSRIKE